MYSTTRPLMHVNPMQRCHIFKLHLLRWIPAFLPSATCNANQSTLFIAFRFPFLHVNFMRQLVSAYLWGFDPCAVACSWITSPPPGPPFGRTDLHKPGNKCSLNVECHCCACGFGIRLGAIAEQAVRNRKLTDPHKQAALERNVDCSNADQSTLLITVPFVFPLLHASQC